MKFLNLLKDQFHITIDLNQINTAKSIMEIAQLVETQSGPKLKELGGSEPESSLPSQFQEDLQLDLKQFLKENDILNLEKKTVQSMKDKTQILLTGVTGFLGSFLLSGKHVT